MSEDFAAEDREKEGQRTSASRPMSAAKSGAEGAGPGLHSVAGTHVAHPGL